MRPVLLLVAFCLAAGASVYSGVANTPDVNLTLALGFGSLATLCAVWLLEDRWP